MMNVVNPVVDTGRRVWLAGIGALALAQDEILDFANRLVERGAITEKESRKLVQDLMEWPGKSVRTAEHEVQHQIDVVVHRLGVVTRADVDKMDLPTKADIQALSEKVQTLARKVDQLRKAEEPHAEQTEKLAGKMQTLNRKVTELQKTVEEQEPDTTATDALANKVQTLNRRVNQIQKAAKEEEAPNGKETEAAAGKEKEKAKK